MYISLKTNESLKTAQFDNVSVFVGIIVRNRELAYLAPMSGTSRTASDNNTVRVCRKQKRDPGCSTLSIRITRDAHMGLMRHVRL